MKISITAMFIFVTALCTLPYIWFILNGKTGVNKTKKIITKLISQEQLNLVSKEIWNNRIIGIDDTKKVLLFAKINDTQNDVYNINLNDVKSCQIFKSTKEFKRDKKVEIELQKLSLELSFISIKPNLILNFYDVDDYFVQDFEMKRAEKWMSLIQQKTHKPVVNKTAA